jgi:choloylglycine hydrolase
MWLAETEYPKDDPRPAVGSQEWIQYQLDTAATVGEVINNAGKVRITSEVKIHFLVSDRAGNAATVEFLGGKLVVHAGGQLAVPTLTNDTYDESLSYAKQVDARKAASDDSLDRFARAAQKTREFGKRPRDEREAAAYAFEILGDAAIKDPGSTRTQWSIVYDQGRGQIYFRTLLSPQIKMVDAKAFDYSCAAPVKIFDINAKEGGDVTAKFSVYTRKANRDLIERTFTATDFLKDVPAQVRDLAASYPEEFPCIAGEQKAGAGPAGRRAGPRTRGGRARLRPPRP